MIRALYGGSFDPIHAGHVALVETLLERGLAGCVHLVPARQSPLKSQAPGAGSSDRWHLVKLAVATVAGVVLDDRELCRRGPSYTVDTLAELVAEHPDDTWRLVIGADAAVDFARWHEPARLLDLAQPLVVARGEVALSPPLVGRVLILDDFAHPASATAIRRDLAAGNIPGPELLPPAVAEAIVAAGLYGWPGAGGRQPQETP